MKRVASLHFPALGIERLRRNESASQPEAAPAAAVWVPTARIPENTKERQQLIQLRERLDQDVGLAREGVRIEDCSCPRGGGWRPGARWASREARQAEIDALPAHQRPPMRMLGRRSEAVKSLQFSGEKRVSAVPSGTGADAPLATTHRTGQRITLAAVSVEAAALGLTLGMAATHARMLVPDLDLRDADSQGDAAFLTRLALFAARRWTPHAAVSGSDGLWLDLSGVAHLFGGERQMGARILRFCARLGFTARIGIAGTTGAAHALARFSPQPIAVCPNGVEADAIAPFPPSALRLDEAALSAARRFGIASVAELLAMPRGPLGRRFGRDTLTRIDQATGRVGEPFDPVVLQEPPSATLRLLEPISTAEAIAQVAGDLASMLTRQLGQLGLGARAILLVCDRVDGDEQRIPVGMSSGSRDPAHIAELLRRKIDTIEPGFGIEAMHLVATRCQPLAPQQIGSEDDVDLPPLVDRIASRIGAAHVFRCSAQESDVPERSVSRVGALETPVHWQRDWPRPVRMLARPERVDKVLAELPDQPPLRFSWRGKIYRVRKADGPERIFGEWWRRSGEADAVRDYFQVEEEGGARFWLFRRGDGVDPKTGDLSWWMHGLFG
jgi:protein ImuB